jgi:hypothetical protein
MVSDARRQASTILWPESPESPDELCSQHSSRTGVVTSLHARERTLCNPTVQHPSFRRCLFFSAEQREANQRVSIVPALAIAFCVPRALHEANFFPVWLWIWKFDICRYRSYSRQTLSPPKVSLKFDDFHFVHNITANQPT